MIPLQDVVPSGRRPLATLAIIGANLLLFAVAAAAGRHAPPTWWTPLAHQSGAQLVINLLWLWLFGDNVEARLRRGVFVLLYAAGAFVALLTYAWAADSAPPPGLAPAAAVGAILGAYFLLLPQSRVLVLLPLPAMLVEVPAAFFLALWWMVHGLIFVALAPAHAGGGDLLTLWVLAAATVLGVATARVVARPVEWKKGRPA